MPLLEMHRDLNADIADEWLQVGHQLTEIFKIALYVKVRLLLSTDIYECAIHVPGTPFDNNSMKNMIEGVVHGTKNEPDAVVGITMLPGLIRYASGEEGFNYNRFLIGNKAPKGVSADILRKATVLNR